MSLLSDFTSAAFTIARSVIGGESLTISGGDAVSCILNESNFSRDYEEGGMEQTGALEAVISLADFVAAYPASIKTYQGAKASARGMTWRVGSIRSGASFVTLSLISANKSA